MAPAEPFPAGAIELQTTERRAAELQEIAPSLASDELRRVPTVSRTSSRASDMSYSALPAIDGGFAAWRFLAAATLLEAIVAVVLN